MNETYHLAITLYFHRIQHVELKLLIQGPKMTITVRSLCREIVSVGSSCREIVSRKVRKPTIPVAHSYTKSVRDITSVFILVALNT